MLLSAAIGLQILSPNVCLSLAMQRGAWGRRGQSALSSTRAGADPNSTPSETASATPAPSWEKLSAILDDDAPDPSSAPVLTLYRDTNGWCPFCERVWICVRAKGLPYRERLINLQDKPDWYKEIVPTKNVPAVLFHDDDNVDVSSSGDDGPKGKPQRRVIWESLDIMIALDEAFPSTPRLVLDTPEYESAHNRTSTLTSAGFAYVYGDRNNTLTSEEKEALKGTFNSELDGLEVDLIERGGPFLLGSNFTGVDAEIVPLLERWRFQLPLTIGFDILDDRPALARWFEAMDEFGPYADRVAGDEYSWTAVSSTFLRIFGGDSPNSDAISRSDDAAASLADSFSSVSADDESAEAAREAAMKILSNHDAIVADCTRTDPKSQKNLPRASDAATADSVLRFAAAALLSPEGAVSAAREGLALPDELDGDAVEMRAEAALAARTVASRLCAPRDMGAPAARLLRGVLAIAADRLDAASD